MQTNYKSNKILACLWTLYNGNIIYPYMFPDHVRYISELHF